MKILDAGNDTQVGDDGNADGDDETKQGCGCQGLTGGDAPVGALVIMLALALALRRRRAQGLLALEQAQGDSPS